MQLEQKLQKKLDLKQCFKQVMETDINLPFISHDPSAGAKNLELRITRAKLDGLIGPR